MHMERMCYNTLWIMEVQSRASGHPGPHNCATLNSSVCARGSIYCSDDQLPQYKTCQRYSSNAVSQPHTVNYFRFKISHITVCTNHTHTPPTIQHTTPTTQHPPPLSPTNQAPNTLFLFFLGVTRLFLVISVF